MEIAENVRRLFKEMILPELSKIQEENQKIVAILELTNKRLDDVNTHLADQSRRIDETNKRIDDVRTELTAQINDVRTELTAQINDVRTELTAHINEVRTELNIRMDKIHSDLVQRIDANNKRIDEFFNTAATKEAQAAMDRRLVFLERDMVEIKQRMAA